MQSLWFGVHLRQFGRPVIVLDSLEVGRRRRRRRKLRQLEGQMRDKRAVSWDVGRDLRVGLEPLLGGRVICKRR